jgi:hypothetical protein
VWRKFDKEMASSSASRLNARPCLGLLLASAFLAGIVCHATSKQTSPSCNGGKAPAGQESRQAANANTKDSDAGVPDHPISHTIKLTWDRSASPQTAVAGYNIFRRESGPNCDKPGNTCVQLNPATAPIQGTTCIDYDVRPGRTYIYQAQSVGTNRKLSSMSNEAKATLK